MQSRSAKHYTVTFHQKGRKNLLPQSTNKVCLVMKETDRKMSQQTIHTLRHDNGLTDAVAPRALAASSQRPKRKSLFEASNTSRSDNRF